MIPPSIEPDPARPATARPLRLLVVMPSWLGDVVMSTPALRLLRDSLPGSFIGGLVRPGLDELIAGSGLLDEVHVDRARGVMGPKLVASRIRPRRYDAALLLANSFSSALITRLAFIPRRIGYDRDGRGLLLTDRIRPERVAEGVRGRLGVGSFAPVPAVEYYLRAAREVVGAREDAGRKNRLELGVTPEQQEAGAGVLRKAGVGAGERYAMLIPGANDVAKRWPAAGYSAVAAHVAGKHGLKVLVSGAPGEAELCDEVVRGALERAGTLPAPSGGIQGGGTGDAVVALPRLGVSIGALKTIVRGATLMVTNDTGPRFVGSAFAVPLVNLYGPTDVRWSVLPENGAPSVDVVADPTLPADMNANEHPERCRIDKIEVERVIEAVERVLGAG